MHTKLLLAVIALCTLAPHPPVGAQPTAPAMRLTEVRRINGVDEDLASTFSRVAVLPGRGVIAYFDDINVRFVFFDSTGKRVANFGRKGGGPGEFMPSGRFTPPGGSARESYSLTLGRIADTLWVYDVAQRMFAVISPDARLLRTMRLPLIDPSGSADTVPAARRLLSFSPQSLTSAGDMLGAAQFGSTVKYTQSDGREGTYQNSVDSAYVVMDARGTVTKTVAPYSRHDAYASTSAPGSGASQLVPFAAYPLRDVSTSGDRLAQVTTTVTSATGGTFTIAVTGARGESLLARTYPFTTRAVTSREADSAYGVIEQRQRATPRPYTNELLEKVRAKIPRAHPPLRSLMVGADGSLVLGVPTAVGAGASAQFLLLSERGDAIGTFSLPRTQTLLEATRSTLWVSERDEDGFAHLVRYRVGG